MQRFTESSLSCSWLEKLPEPPQNAIVRSLDGLDSVPTGLLVGFQFQQATLLSVQQQVIEGAKTIRTLVEAGMAALECLLDHRTVDRLVLVAFFGQGFQRFHHQVERIGDGQASGAFDLVMKT